MVNNPNPITESLWVFRVLENRFLAELSFKQIL